MYINNPFKAGALILLVILNAPHLLGQGEVTRQPILVYQVGNGSAWSLLNAKPFLPFANIMREPTTTVALRVCTKEPLLRAFYFSGRRPYDILEHVRMIYGYTADRVSFVVTEECGSDSSAKTVADVWIIPGGTSPPSSTRSIKMCQVKQDPSGLNRRIRTDREFDEMLNKLTSALNSETQAIGVIVGAYSENGRVS